MKTKILFLYTELAEYVMACVKTLAADYPVEVHMVRWPVNKEAPFTFAIPAGVYLYEKEAYTRSELIALARQLAPDLIFCSGWLDKDYLAVVRAFQKSVPTVVGMDNHWKGTARQQLARVLAPFTLQRLFTNAFVAGAPQYTYARKLSFAPDQILQGYYSADVPVFDQQYQQNRAQKAQVFPKRLLYVGRYVPQKGLDVLWEAFVQLQEAHPSDWELWCLGTGPLEHTAPPHPQLKHFGFVQPDQMARFIRETGVFVLPSLSEPWGVVVHEFAAAGFPIVCSNAVGAATAFLAEGQNGYTFRAGDVADVTRALLQITSCAPEQLLAMGDKSNALALQHTPTNWAANLMGLLPTVARTV